MKEKEILLEQYKLYVESAEKVSDRRQSANNYFLTLNSVLVAFSGYLTSFTFQIWHIIIAVAGICISFLWLLTLKSCRNLNSGKFKIIHSLEKKLPAKLFKDEWDCLEKGENKKTYLKLSVVEQGVPIIFFVLYILIIVIMILPLLGWTI